LNETAEDINRGTVTSVRISVVDALFPHRLPPIYNLLLAGEAERHRRRLAKVAELEGREVP
jgi:F0F1-type ATP synthase beta subunit